MCYWNHYVVRTQYGLEHQNVYWHCKWIYTILFPDLGRVSPRVHDPASFQRTKRRSPYCCCDLPSKCIRRTPILGHIFGEYSHYLQCYGYTRQQPRYHVPLQFQFLFYGSLIPVTMFNLVMALALVLCISTCTIQTLKG